MNFILMFLKQFADNLHICKVNFLLTKISFKNILAGELIKICQLS